MGSGIAMACGIDHRRGLDPALLWLWHWPAAAAPIRPLAWQVPYAVRVVLKGQKKKKECTGKEILLHCTGNYVQSLVIEHDEI